MQTTLKALSLLLLSMPCGACNGGYQTLPTPPVPTTAPAASRPTTAPVQTPPTASFNVRSREVITVVLPSSGSGGYSWHLAPGYKTEVLRFKGQRAGELPPNSPPGRFADEIFELEALGPGETTLVFSNYREWEGPSNAVETRRYPVVVR